MGTGRSINQQIFIEQLPWLAAGESSAGGRHIRKLSIKRCLGEREGCVLLEQDRKRRRVAFLWDSRAIMSSVASVKSTLELCRAPPTRPLHTDAGRRTPPCKRAVVLQEEGKSCFLGERLR